MARLKFVPDHLPDDEGRWLTVPNRIIVPGEDGWWMAMCEAYAPDTPLGHHIVMFENAGGTQIDEVGSRKGH